jgi:hypothetical protein
MNKKNLLWIEVLFIAAIFCIAQESFARSPQDIDHWIHQLQSRDWREREDAVSKLALLPPKLKTDQVKKALINELKNELERVESNKIEPCLNSDCGEGGEEGYVNSLMETVAKMRDDRAFPLFVRIGSPTFLVEFGDKGVNAILVKLDTMTKCSEEEASVKILADALQQKKHGYVPQGAIRQDIKKALIKTLGKSQHPQEGTEWYEKRAGECANVRFHIVRALGSLAESGDKDVIPVIKSMSEQDPYARGLSNNKKYIVREEAQKILDNLGTKGLAE